ncbi:MAG TPA: cation:proton antiporter [Planctomycetaceae bacterium]|nr:cation:proton antiporter [Planctomycetaceae bacterium]
MPDSTTPPRSLGFIGYSLMVVLTIAAFLVIRSFGENLEPPTPAVPSGPSEAPLQPSDVLVHVLIALVAVIAVGQLLARLFAFVQQPPVIGEVIAGILLGPSLIGVRASAWILPPKVAPFLGVISQLGVILYMFIVGLELNAGLIKGRAKAAVATSHASILVPFLLGSLLALILYPRLSTSDVPFTNFALFVGVAMSITAFPVLARILTDLSLTRTELGVVAISCAATDDVTAWCLLAFVVGVAQAQLGKGLIVVAGTVAYIAAMLFIVRPLVVRLARHPSAIRLSRTAAGIVFVMLLASALATELIGIHAIFGAFLLGALVPHDSDFARDFARRTEQIVTVLLLPAFFALTGMRTRIDLLTGVGPWLLCGVIILVATIGKFGGTFAAARLTGLGWRDAAALGALMNTRGLMELIVLNIGLDLGVISPTLFAMMVLMALATTMLTSPVVRSLVHVGPGAGST